MTIRKKSFLNWILDFIERHEVLIVILCGVALLRLPGLFEPNRYADEDIYLTIGQGLRRGLLLYRDIYDNKTPLIYMVAALAGNVMWFRFILLIWNLINVGLINGLAKKIVKNKWGVILATILFAFFSTIPLLEGEIANGEIFMIMPVTAAIYLLFTKSGQITENKMRFLWAGILWSIGFLFKSPPVVELFGFVFFYMIFLSSSFSDFFKKILNRRIWLLGLGFSIPILVSVIYFYLNGIGDLYLKSALLQNFSYLSSWGGGSTKSSIFSGGLVTRGTIMVGVLIATFGLRKKIGNYFGFISIWAITALFGAMLSGRPYPHYLIELVAPFSLLLSLIIFEKKGIWLVFGSTLFGLLIVSLVRYNFWYYKSLPYYVNFVSYVFGQKTKKQYYQFWGDNVLRDYQVSAYITKFTQKNDHIFVWGTEPAIYAISNRTPVTKYTVAYHIFDFSAQGEVANILMKAKPKVIIVIKDEAKFSELAGLLASNYALAATYGNTAVYQIIK